jgi:dolichol-phosphate mannosyltransferase
MQILAILCPVYNEDAAIPLFVARLVPVMRELETKYRIRLVFLNNASTDESLARIEAAKAGWAETFVISMSRNVGYQASLECGLRHVDADVFVIIDVDCEDPPEMIPQFVAAHEQGFDIVYGERIDRPEPKPLKSARKFFYRLLQKIADEEILLDMAEFSLITREVRDAIMDDRSSYPFLRASISRVGFRRAAIPFTRQKRVAGAPHYNLVSMSVFAVGGLLSASTLLLRLPIYVLPFWILALCGLGIWAVAWHSVWAALAGLLLFAVYTGSSIAFMAIYVARGYKNSLQRPNAVIDRKRSNLPPRAEG